MKRRYQRAQKKLDLCVREEAPEPQPQPVQDDIPVIRLKNEKGHFKKEAIMCVMALTGECEVPAHRCGEVIQAVVAQVCQAHIPQSDLPSQRSALRFADHAHVIGKAHVAETITNADHFDLHSDGTSRGGRKYVGQQMTVDGLSVSAGFVPVATEDTSTLVEVSIQLLEELSDLYPPDESTQNFANILQNLSGVMTDRASVMKSFGRELNKRRQTLLQTDEDLQFLHCNAHFLLGLGAEVKKSLTAIEKERRAELGREETLPFHSYNDCSTIRYIFMACDCLGPRGDDRAGCRDSWEAYCSMVQKRSTVTSFRENRFNNLFQAAASLHYHRRDIEDCLGTYLLKRNKKVQMVLDDCRSEMIDCHLIALGLQYFWITGPYWSLLGMSLHYLEFYKEIGRLHALLTEWQQDASSALEEDWHPLFPDINFHYDESIFRSLREISNEKKQAVLQLLQTLSTAFLSVIERQLGDFLPGGRYFDVQDPELQERMSHSALTNLVGEECFGDLDFSLFKRRNASLHHHSTINMLKRNKSVSSWLMSKPEHEQDHLLRLSASKAVSFRSSHNKMEKDVIEKKKELLVEVQRKKEEMAEKKRLRIGKIIAALRPHSGPCTTATDVANLLNFYFTNRGLKEALKAELQYQKLVLSQNSEFLKKVTGPVLTLFNKLTQFFGGDPLPQLPPRQEAGPLDQVDAQPPRKRTRRQLDIDSDADNDSDTEDMDSDISDTDSLIEGESNQNLGSGKDDVCYEFGNFSFQNIGEIVAVYYDDDFYIGEVIKIMDETKADINFMEKTSVLIRGDSMFRWSRRPEIYTISSTVIFAGSLNLAPSSSSGRIFVVEQPTDLKRRYEAFKNWLYNN